MPEGEKFKYDKEKEQRRQKKMDRLEKQVMSLKARLGRSKAENEARDEFIKTINLEVRRLEAESEEQKEIIDRQSREIEAQAKKLEKKPKRVVIVTPVPLKSIKLAKGDKAIKIDTSNFVKKDDIFEIVEKLIEAKQLERE